MILFFSSLKSNINLEFKNKALLKLEHFFEFRFIIDSGKKKDKLKGFMLKIIKTKFTKAQENTKFEFDVVQHTLIYN